ncbi:hypothetical protein Ctha_2547 [Chloroherpeton thalassium ATCC 35110]|uniref:DUF883 domain-containing protein n=1 Tax=Chloroherpeton thalassium (strain ATCC 35110 / GB-78) TaxID=517418 RepID=B3QXT1_CHLT3|nr:DUF883 C-terminal domain-containing protein [Chloroherpeton thalassium]ACF14996.1 hypothetical protein Ctha_2547 [Chloroherpeton thalassium ATCC 35110]
MSEQQKTSYQDEFSEETAQNPQKMDLLEQVTATPLYGAVEQLAKEASEYIRKNPLKASLISLGAGLVVGLLLNRKK